MTTMDIPKVFKRIGNKIAPAVCAWCDEGTGTRRDPATGRIERCPVCDGTGRPKRAE